MTMLLSELCADLPATLRGRDGVVSAVTLDSRKAGAGVVFAAVKDPIRDGEAFVADALARGASAVLAARELPVGDTPLILAEEPRVVFALMAHRLAGSPAAGMIKVAVTGTNGKTTFTYLLESILRVAGRSPGVIGTVSHRYAGRSENADNTTPEAPEIAALLARMRAAGVDTVVMEASSHGLALARVAGLDFDFAAFTNLSRDHMDFHASEDEYLAAKTLLFTRHRTPGGVAVINIDDRAGRSIAKTAGGTVRTYGVSDDADYRIVDARSGRDGLQMRLETPRGPLTLASPLAGHYQVDNTAAAAATALEMSIEPDVVARGVAELANVPGRMERVGDGEPAVYVDYAHTPDALDNVVSACRRLTTGRLFTVFGCGGDRDGGKRPLMARAAAKRSDIVVVTSDNPRTENPLSIIDQVLAGLDRAAMDELRADDLAGYGGRHGLLVEPDRRVAIAAAVAGSREGDTVLIAGKGHEDYQILGKTKVHLDDREEAAAALSRRAASRTVSRASVPTE